MNGSLFILKLREDYSADPSYSGSYQIATGMWNSAKFVVDALTDSGRTSHVVICIDANYIDAVVTQYDPEYVFIEGLWVTPAKFAELMALPRHVGRKWVVRIHSELPFLAQEGIAMDWTAQYLRQGVIVAPNAQRAHQQFVWYANHLGALPAPVETLVPYLPNVYPTTFPPISGLDTSAKTSIDIACFGAFRQLKNHLQQVFIAARFAEELGLPLNFHINNRIDGGGNPCYKNTVAAVQNIGATLVEHPWEDRATFLNTLSSIDLLLQVSMSETFNIVAADATLVGRPVLASNEISWIYPLYADPQNVDKSLEVLRVIWGNKRFYIQQNRSRLIGQSRAALRKWLSYLPS